MILRVTLRHEVILRVILTRPPPPPIYKGFVAGFWNGLCGEVDKSKPPVGGLALQLLLERDPTDLWIADLLVNQFIMWNRWWADTRQYVTQLSLKASNGSNQLFK